MNGYPVYTLSTHIEIGDKTLSECYPQIVEDGTEQNRHEVPRIVFRACLPSRLKDNEKFNFRILDDTKWNIDEVKQSLSEIDFRPGSLYFIYVGKYKTLKTPVKTALVKRGFTPNDIVNAFLEKNISCSDHNSDGEFLQCFYDESKKVAVVVGSVTSDYYWNICAGICPRIIPWYFGVKADCGKFENHPLTADEQELVKAINIGESEFIAAAQKIYEQTDIATKVQDMRFKSMFSGIRKKLIDRHKSNIRNWNLSFKSFENQMQDLAVKIRDASLACSALENSGEDSSVSSFSALFSRPNIAIKTWAGNDLIFSIASMVSPFNLDTAEESLDNMEHEIYNCSEDSGLEFGECRDLMHAVFVDRKIKLPVYSNFRLSLEHNSISVIQHEGPATKFSGYTPHPHHEYYGCTGSNIGTALRSMADGNYVDAIAQLVGSVATITFTDYTVMNDFARKALWNTTKTPFLLPDGTMANCLDACKWLKENNDNEEDA